MELTFVVLVAKVGVEPLDPRRGVITPAVFMDFFTGGVEGPVVFLGTVLQRAADASERSSCDLGFQSVIGEAVLQLQIDRPAEGVESEDRIAGPYVSTVNGHGGHQVKIHGIAKRFVDTHAVQINGQPLRGALRRGGPETMQIDVLRERVALDIGELKMTWIVGNSVSCACATMGT